MNVTCITVRSVIDETTFDPDDGVSQPDL